MKIEWVTFTPRNLFCLAVTHILSCISLSEEHSLAGLPISRSVGTVAVTQCLISMLVTFLIVWVILRSGA